MPLQTLPKYGARLNCYLSFQAAARSPRMEWEGAVESGRTVIPRFREDRCPPPIPGHCPCQITRQRSHHHGVRSSRQPRLGLRSCGPNMPARLGGCGGSARTAGAGAPCVGRSCPLSHEPGARVSDARWWGAVAPAGHLSGRDRRAGDPVRPSRPRVSRLGGARRRRSARRAAGAGLP